MSFQLTINTQAGTFLRWRESLAKRLVSWTQPLYAPLKRWQSPGWKTSFEDLVHYPPDSLGFRLWCLLTSHDLALMPPFEDHDIFHLVFGYDLTVQDEARMQFCLLGSGKRSLYVIGACLIALGFFPEKWTSYRQAYQRGQQAENCANWPWESLLRLPLKTVQQWIFKI